MTHRSSPARSRYRKTINQGRHFLSQRFSPNHPTLKTLLQAPLDRLESRLYAFYDYAHHENVRMVRSFKMLFGGAFTFVLFFGQINQIFELQVLGALGALYGGSEFMLGKGELFTSARLFPIARGLNTPRPMVRWNTIRKISDSMMSIKKPYSPSTLRKQGLKIVKQLQKIKSSAIREDHWRALTGLYGEHPETRQEQWAGHALQSNNYDPAELKKFRAFKQHFLKAVQFNLPRMVYGSKSERESFIKLIQKLKGQMDGCSVSAIPDEDFLKTLHDIFINFLMDWTDEEFLPVVLEILQGVYSEQELSDVLQVFTNYKSPNGYQGSKQRLVDEFIKEKNIMDSDSDLKDFCQWIWQESYYFTDGKTSLDVWPLLSFALWCKINQDGRVEHQGYALTLYKLCSSPVATAIGLSQQLMDSYKRLYEDCILSQA